MFEEALPRLAVRVQELFPEAKIELADSSTSLKIKLPQFPKWHVQVRSISGRHHFQIIEASIFLQYRCLESISDDDFFRFVAAENLGLRGATLLIDETSKRALKLRSNFIGQKGRTRDEAENLAIDVVSLLRLARMLEDRVVHSSVFDHFSFEMYYSQYLAQGTNRNRYINYARHIFKGSAERVFTQAVQFFKDDHKFTVTPKSGLSAGLELSENDHLQISLLIPAEIPVLMCSLPLTQFKGQMKGQKPPQKVFELITRLNLKVDIGHFEVTSNGRSVSFVTWKHLTNDLRFYSLDQMLLASREARVLLNEALGETKKEPVASQLNEDESSKWRTEPLEAVRSAA